MEMTEADMERYGFARDALRDAQKVFQFLKEAKIPRYAAKFIEQGFSTVEDLSDMKREDLEECGLVPGHINRFFAHQQKVFNPVGSLALPAPIASPGEQKPHNLAEDLCSWGAATPLLQCPALRKISTLP
eukprot:Skav212414  [mRNA]  locus=scaffold202:15010:15518:- [translate_table: standard]